MATSLWGSEMTLWYYVRAMIAATIRTYIYRLLLGILILLLVAVAGFGNQSALPIATGLLLVVSVLVAVAFMEFKDATFWAYVIASLATFALDSVRENVYQGVPYEIITVVCGLMYAILLLIAIAVVVYHIGKQRVVTSDTIIGSVCAYILIGLFWYIIYQMLFDASNQRAFRGIVGPGDFELMYFSFTTLTTLGHGDIVPTMRLSQIVCNLEAIVGQMFPAVFISRLVSLWVVNELKS
jgi:voltage-gated potassium channel